MATVSVNRIQQFKRRSNRMALNAKIGVSGKKVRSAPSPWRPWQQA